MKELIILVGSPGSGKSTLAKQLTSQSSHFSRISQDEMGKQGHMSNFINSINTGFELVIVDRMGFNKEQRKRYIEPAKKLGYKTKIIVIHEPYQVCLERMKLRTDHETIKDEKTARKALEFFFKNYERPTEDEADEIEFRYPEGEKPKAIICDLDGTLCNVDHRLHFVKNTETKFENIIRVPKFKPDWKNFFYNMAYDPVNEWCDEILAGMIQQGYQIVLCSGRPDDYRKVTENWLQEEVVYYEDLFMRRRSDFRKDDIIKEIILDFEILTKYTPVFAIDDRASVVKMWRKRGIVTLACADGDF